MLDSLAQWVVGTQSDSDLEADKEETKSRLDILCVEIFSYQFVFYRSFLSDEAKNKENYQVNSITPC